LEPKVASLIEKLQLESHPEGGYYREIFRSGSDVSPSDERESRPALTSIYFLLVDGEFSRWHRLRSDEVWHFIEGSPVELLRLDGDFSRLERGVLGSATDALEPVASVSAGSWQAARTMGSYSLVGCTVGPGFDFADFELLAEEAQLAERLQELYPDLAALI
jgi:predicted cupin superfamily sugar epimerase